MMRPALTPLGIIHKVTIMDTSPMNETSSSSAFCAAASAAASSTGELKGCTAEAQEEVSESAPAHKM
jgi:hypothetical protein